MPNGILSTLQDLKKQCEVLRRTPATYMHDEIFLRLIEAAESLIAEAERLQQALDESYQRAQAPDTTNGD